MQPWSGLALDFPGKPSRTNAGPQVPPVRMTYSVNNKPIDNW
jgi:hypothetical protein